MEAVNVDVRIHLLMPNIKILIEFQINLQGEDPSSMKNVVHGGWQSMTESQNSAISTTKTNVDGGEQM